MSKHRIVKSNRALEANAYEYTDQEKVMALFSSEQQETIKQLKTSFDGISEAGRRIGIYGSRIFLEINSNLIR